MKSSESMAYTSVPLEAVLSTEELERRPLRVPNYQAENRALITLAEQLANSPEDVLQRLVDIALSLCRAHSAGISLLEERGPVARVSPTGDHFRWYAVAGRWASMVWTTTTPREHSPCGTVLDRNVTLLFNNPHRHYRQLLDFRPLLVEALLVPFYVNDQAVGTIWAVAHDESRRFDAEDQRLLESLGAFAATAYRTRSLVAAQTKLNQQLEEEIAQHRLTEAALQRAKTELEKQAKEQERTLIAREVHDQLGQLLTAIKLEVSRLSPDSQMSNGAIRERVLTMVDQTLDVTNDIVRALQRSAVVQLELATAIEKETLEFQERAGIECDLSIRPMHFKLGGESAEALYRVFKEAMTNAARHSGASHIDIRLRQNPGEVILEIRDNGRGIDDAAISSLRSFGLMSMRDRLSTLGGWVRIENIAGDGTVVTALLPRGQQ